MKCQNCGAEIGDSKFCEFCGSQISAQMRREQEEVKKAGCPSCGSGNITFKRENQGEIRGKNSKQVIHQTVGVCKDCGYTWTTTNTPKKKKTWLWVLGWIFIFPVPLTILLLRKKDMNSILKYGIIAVAWIVYLIIAIAGGGNGNTTDTATDTSEQSVVATDSSVIDVSLEVSPNINEEDGSVLFGVATNLPDDTELMVTVTQDDFTAQDKVVILNGKGYTSEFSNQGEALEGTYTVTVSMSLPKLQKESVQAVIGSKGENITGKYVVQSDIDSSNVISGDFEFTF